MQIRRNPSLSRLLACCLAFLAIWLFDQVAHAQWQSPAAPPEPRVGPDWPMTAGPAQPVGQTVAVLQDPVALAPGGSREIAPLVLGEDIALGLRHSAVDQRDHHDGWSYRVYVTNLAWDAAGNLSPIARDGPVGRELLLQRESPLVLFNLVAAVEWDATAEYLADLDTAFRRASDYLFDLSDGQMALGQVTIVDNARERDDLAPERAGWWKSADMRFNPNNITEPKHIPAEASSTHQGVALGPFWSRRGVVGNWSDPDGYRTLIHELAHHALGLYDEYGDNEFCTKHRDHLLAGDKTTASAMSWQFTASEFSACPPHQPDCDSAIGSAPWPLWSAACQQTRHYRTTEQSTWATIDQRLSDAASPPRWEILSPTERGVVMPGPIAVPAAFPWPQIIVDSYIDPSCKHDESACLPVSTVCVVNMETTCGGNPSTVSLGRQNTTAQIGLGKLDANGCITILEAKPGSTLLITCSNDDNYEATMTIDESMSATMTMTYTEAAPAPTGAPLTAFANALLAQDAAVLDWMAGYWENVQAVRQSYPDLARNLFGPSSELPANPATLIALLEQQAWSEANRQGVVGPRPPIAGDIAFDINLPAADALWWQQDPGLDEPANAQQRGLQQVLPLVAQAYRRQANIAAQTVDADSGGFLITPDGVWTAEAARQPAPVDWALESISAVPGQQVAGDIATGFTLAAPDSFVEPILVKYMANCGPDGGVTDLALVDVQTDEQISPTFIESCFPVEFAIDRAGTYRLVSTAHR
jgi:hypothetical protein